MSWVWHNKKLQHREPDWNAPVADTGNARLEYLYAWERRCRGYDLHPYPVAVEPPFVPYQPETREDLARQYPQTHPGTLSHVSLQLPTDQKVSLDSAEAFLSELPFSHQPVAFEILADNRDIAYQITSSPDTAQSITSSAQIHWPKADIAECPDFLEERISYEVKQRATPNSFVVEFGLQEFTFLPIACSDSLTADPLAGVVAALGALEPGEIAGLQILFTPANRHWNDALLEVAEEFDAPVEGSFYRHENPMVSAARVKTGFSLYAVVIRVFAISEEGQAKAFALCKKIGGALSSFNQSQGQTGNALLALANQDTTNPAANYLPANGNITTVFDRTSHRSGLLLSLPELAGLVHPPGHTLQHQKLLRLDPNASSLSEELLQAEGTTIGIHHFRQQEQKLVWPDQFRNRHAYILGATRMGKSTLLQNLITQDIANGSGLCLIDPHGDLALDVLDRIPDNRKEDVLYLDLSDREFPLSLGLLEANSEHEQRLLCSDLLSILRRLFAASWGDRLEHILRHVILTLLSASRQSGTKYTLRDVRPLLSNKAFRQRIIDGLDDPELQAFWHGEFYSYSAGSFAPLYNKLGLLISSPLVRNIIAGRQSKFSFSDIIRNKQILLVNLASSQIGNDNAHFLGAVLVSKLQIAAMQNLRLAKQERTPFTLYVDEFQNFVVSSFETILSEAGKAGLSLVMANQFLEQLSAHLQTAILSNAGTLVSFRVSSNSGRLLEKEFAGRFTSNQLVSLERGEAIARVGSAADSYDIQTLPPSPASGMNFTDEIRRQSREAICRSRQEVEEELAADAKRQAEEQEAEERAEAERKEAEKALKKQIAEEKKMHARQPKPEPPIPNVSARPAEIPHYVQEEVSAQERSENAPGENVASVTTSTSTPAQPADAPLLEPDCFGVQTDE